MKGIHCLVGSFVVASTFALPAVGRPVTIPRPVVEDKQAPVVRTAPVVKATPATPKPSPEIKSKGLLPSTEGRGFTPLTPNSTIIYEDDKEKK